MTVSVGFLLAVCGVRLLIREWLSQLSVRTVGFYTQVFGFTAPSVSNGVRFEPSVDQFCRRLKNKRLPIQL